MIDAAVVGLRLLQYAGAMVLMGSSLFFLYGLRSQPRGQVDGLLWTHRAMVVAAAVLAVSALLGLIAQTALLAGSLADGLDPQMLKTVVAEMALGKAAIVRAGIALLALAALFLVGPSRGVWIITAALGTIAAASMAWMGHGAVTDGPGGGLHLVADIVHIWSASVWIGALVAFTALLIRSRSDPAVAVPLHDALRRFSGLGSILVALLIATGAINSWFLVGMERIASLWTTPYGRLLSVKLLFLVLMLALAALNRLRLTPALGRASDSAIAPEEELAALRRSVGMETALGFAILTLVAWFGTLEPPSAM